MKDGLKEMGFSVPYEIAVARPLRQTTRKEREEALWSRVERINERLEEYEKIRKIALVRNDFPGRVRSVTHFQKIKVDRKAVEELYKREIQQIYGGS